MQLVLQNFLNVFRYHCVHLGNNGAAFVEILVGRSSWDPSQDYKVSIARRALHFITEIISILILNYFIFFFL